ncbi:MAG: hypothetical protein A2062_03620 [Omnitrophica WOR_2 bacterium GWA2_44_7]|nr:MAG: hypothetical protein A2062_03620 [Omnitrophica WOR_2 bacterium GWA2_44_7]
MGSKTKWLFLGSGLAVGIILGLGFAGKPAIVSPVHAAHPVSAEPFTASFESAVELVASRVGKTVVSISTVRTQRLPGMSRYYFGTPSEDDIFRRFFEDFFGEMPEREFKQQGLGSGVIIDKQGYILTNEHVVADADKITVTLSDGKEYKAEVKGTDKRSDLAVIKITGDNFPAASLGDSDTLRIGQWVIAIGNPFGYALHNPEPTVTVGVVSALHRSLGRSSVDRDYGDLIQTDAAINPGNSGGPLVNLKGEVVGINVAIFSTTGGYQGIGFAVPISSAQKIVAKLIEGKTISYGWLGVSVQNLDDTLAQYFGLKEKRGVLVSQVMDKSPAQKAGIKEGDVILKFNGVDTNTVNSLLKSVGTTEAGKKVRVAFIRDKIPFTVAVEVGLRPETSEEQLLPSEKDKDVSAYWRGIRVMEITAEVARQYRLKAAKGVVVVDIKPDSEADAAGMVAGDIIEEINKTVIDTIATYARVTQSIGAGDCLIRSLRGFFVLKGGKK